MPRPSTTYRANRDLPKIAARREAVKARAVQPKLPPAGYDPYEAEWIDRQLAAEAARALKPEQGEE